MVQRSIFRVGALAALVITTAILLGPARASAQLVCGNCDWVTVVADADICPVEFCMTTNDCEICYQVDPGNTFRIECIDGATFKMLVCIRNGVKQYVNVPLNGCTGNFLVPGGCCVRACLTLVNGCYELRFSRGVGLCAACVHQLDDIR